MGNVISGGTQGMTYNSPTGNDLYVDAGGLGNPKTHLVSLNGFTNASQVGLIWDVSEANGHRIDLNYLRMDVYAGNGSVIFSALFTDSNNSFGVSGGTPSHDLANPGIGHGDFFFGLTSSEATQLQTAAMANGGFSNLWVGMETWSRYADDGQDTWFLGKGADPIPEPATILLFGTGIAALAGVARRKRS